MENRFNCNPYYSPEKCGLEIADVFDHDDLSYEFETVVIWKKGGNYYFASDAGCSCPVPFEDITELSDLTLLNNETFFNLSERVNNGFNGMSSQVKSLFLSKWKEIIRRRGN